MSTNDLKLGIISSKNSLTDKLTEKFSDKFIDVEILDKEMKHGLSNFNYLILNLLEEGVNLDDFISDIRNLDLKIIVLAPLLVKENQKSSLEGKLNKLINSCSNVGVLLVPELLGEYVKYNDSYLSHSIVLQSLSSERIKIPAQNIFINIVSVSKLAEVVVKEMFSFGISGQLMALSGPKRYPKNFILNYLNWSEDNILVLNEGSTLVEVNKTSTLKVDFSVRLAVKSFSKTLLPSLLNASKKDDIDTSSERILVQPDKNIQSDVKEVKKLSRKSKILLSLIPKIIFVFLTVLIMPLVLLTISILLLINSIKYTKSDLVTANKLINISLKTTSISQQFSLGIPVYFDYSNIVYKSAILFKEALELASNSSEFVTKIIGKENYDLNYYSDNISSVLDRINTDAGFIQSDLNELSDPIGKIIKNTLNQKGIDISLFKQKIYLVRNFSSRLSTLLGMEKPSKYLILFQNNMELRPTGGFIGSFALVTFDKGRMSEVVVNDIYSADGQLKGHVDPPEPLRDYLGEGGWYMRDSNWDPDFKSSAAKIEWFLEKEINTTVEGVVAIDLSFVKKLLNIIGPLNLKDFNLVITPENLYSTTQSEVESDFFPGSIKKAGFMSALSKQLILEIESLPSEKYFSFLKTVYESLESRHIQVSLHDLNSQKSIEELGYAGLVKMDEKCGERCFKDGYSLIDANLGVNKSNLYVTRNQNINVGLGKNVINHSLVVDYKNNASTAIGNMGIYKTYTRLLLPKNLNIKGVRMYDQSGSYQDVKYDVSNLDNRVEVGFLFEVMPQTEKRIQIEWDIYTEALKDGGEYVL
nr:DUF4012 domain-containing protein [Candidatus Dojkabacteria bacterium]